MTAKTKLIGAGAAIAAMLAAMGASSFAQFTSTSTSTSQSFTAGTVKITVSQGALKYMESEHAMGPNSINMNIDSPANMAPGDTWSAPLTVTNNGSLTELFTISSSGMSGALFSGSTPADVTYNLAGPGPETPLTSSDYVVLAPGKSITVMVNVHLPYGVGNGYQGAQGAFTITASAEQADNTSLAPGDQLINPGSSQPNPPAGTNNPPPQA
ncbi:spore coat protein [Sulfobacillus thermosulfidooxidans DSM 9293]|uniref:Spore coat protein n=2 Tax=Sulfobacillus thermosulfidooxidans TaxID=28034 RepID=A0A1W1WBX6_SULTA|nr:hypothetical protein [Sulfobacillus thermosulfidooxidans]PSR21127.1 MAG: hypothetical protein C7B47_17485 [Sulfobacillus thermosulfidooxidans]SMC03725.1 spore coat protein [Sulfobacillus thermosulfidooxidans DSM 9293]